MIIFFTFRKISSRLNNIKKILNVEEVGHLIPLVASKLDYVTYNETSRSPPGHPTKSSMGFKCDLDFSLTLHEVVNL